MEGDYVDRLLRKIGQHYAVDNEHVRMLLEYADSGIPRFAIPLPGFDAHTGDASSLRLHYVLRNQLAEGLHLQDRLHLLRTRPEHYLYSLRSNKELVSQLQTIPFPLSILGEEERSIGKYHQYSPFLITCAAIPEELVNSWTRQNTQYRLNKAA